jgi:long-chain acyl-CoA synthetase
VPMYLGGTHDAMPVGAALPKQRDLFVKIGDPIRADAMRERTRGMARSAAYRLIAREAELAVRALGGLPPPDAGGLDLDRAEDEPVEAPAERGAPALKVARPVPQRRES